MRILSSGETINLKGGTLKEDIIIKGPFEDITICNGTIKGEIRARPNKKMLSGNTEPGYTKIARAAAPSKIRIFDILFDTDGSTHQLYLGPGCTKARVKNCRFIGKSKGPSIYLSPEGGNHLISRCEFEAKTGGRREVLSVDGSTNNIIERNKFRRCKYGGVYVYRNSGENGTVRHQKPTHNQIIGNSFDLSGMVPVRLSNGSGHQKSPIYIPYGIILGSRMGDSAYAELDNMYDVGSGKSDLDFADFNIVQNNKFRGDWFGRHILDNGKQNTLRNNQ